MLLVMSSRKVMEKKKNGSKQNRFYERLCDGPKFCNIDNELLDQAFIVESSLGDITDDTEAFSLVTDNSPSQVFMPFNLPPKQEEGPTKHQF